MIKIYLEMIMTLTYTSQICAHRNHPRLFSIRKWTCVINRSLFWTGQAEQKWSLGEHMVDVYILLNLNIIYVIFKSLSRLCYVHMPHI